MPDTKFSQFTDSTDFTDLVGLEGGNNAKINKDNLKKSLDILRHRVVVNQDNVSTTLGGVIDPTMEYFLDGVTDTVIYSQPRVINNFQGGRDVAYFTGSANVIIKENNYVYWQVVNLTDDADCTLENASSYSIKER